MKIRYGKLIRNIKIPSIPATSWYFLTQELKKIAVFLALQPNTTFDPFKKHYSQKCHFMPKFWLWHALIVNYKGI